MKGLNLKYRYLIMFAKQTKWIFKAPKIWDKDDTDKKLVFFLTALTMVLKDLQLLMRKK